MVHSLEKKIAPLSIIVGSEGFIGRHLVGALPHALPLNRTQLEFPHFRLDLPKRPYRYAFIAAGITNPLKCHHNPSASYLCNVISPLELGKELLKREIIPIFFSSDYVFDDALNLYPLNEYGRQKRELEINALKLNALIIRLSKVYGVEKGDGTLFDAMAAHLSSGRAITAAYDQMFAPLFVGDMVTFLLELLERGERGIVPCAGPSCASRFEMAQRVAHKLNADRSLVKKIALSEVNDGIRRPKNLSLTGDFPSLSWEEGVDRVVKNYEK